MQKKTPDYKRLIPVNGCSVSRFSNRCCCDIGHDSPPRQELVVRIDLQVERLVDAFAEEGKLWQVFPILGDPAHYHQPLVVVPAELRARELHSKREFWIVLRKLGGK